jgi:hypothetical protein
MRIGQVELMNAYKEFFGQHGIHVDRCFYKGRLEDHIRTLNIRNTLFTLWTRALSLSSMKMTASVLKNQDRRQRHPGSADGKPLEWDLLSS